LRVNRIIIKGFKSIKELELELGDLTILIGPNSSGKSSILEAFTIIASDKIPLEDTFLMSGEDVSVSLKVSFDSSDVKHLKYRLLKELGIRKEPGGQREIAVHFKLHKENGEVVMKRLPLKDEDELIIDFVRTRIYFVPESRMVGRADLFRVLDSLGGLVIDFGRVGDVKKALSQSTSYEDVRLRIEGSDVVLELYDADVGLWVPFKNVGAGVKALIIPMLALSTANDVVVIDDFDLGMHTSLQVRSVGVLRDALERGVQVIMSTHSPAVFLGALKLHKEGAVRNLKAYLVYKEGHTKVYELPLSPPFALPGEVERALEEVGAKGVFAEDVDLIADIATAKVER